MTNKNNVQFLDVKKKKKKKLENVKLLITNFTTKDLQTNLIMNIITLLQ